MVNEYDPLGYWKSQRFCGACINVREPHGPFGYLQCRLSGQYVKDKETCSKFEAVKSHRNPNIVQPKEVWR